jgi:nicotinamidase-related amidase
VKRALIVVDVQNEHIRGALAVVYPSLHVSMPNIALVMDSAAESTVLTVVVTRVEPSGAPHFAKDRSGSAVHTLIADNPRDAVLETSGESDAAEQRLAPYLRDHEVTTATLVGYTAEGTLSRLANLLADAGIDVEVLEDATGSHEPADESLDARAVYERALDELEHHRSITVGTTTDWDRAVHEDRPVARAKVHLSRENEHPDGARDRFEEIEAEVRAKADQGIADGESYDMHRTLATGWFLL